MLWALVLAMRADAHTYGPLVRRRDEKFIVLTISFDSREEVNIEVNMSSCPHLSAHLFTENFQAINNHHMNSNTTTPPHSRTADRLPSDAPALFASRILEEV